MLAWLLAKHSQVDNAVTALLIELDGVLVVLRDEYFAKADSLRTIPVLGPLHKEPADSLAAISCIDEDPAQVTLFPAEIPILSRAPVDHAQRYFPSPSHHAEPVKLTHILNHLIPVEAQELMLIDMRVDPLLRPSRPGARYPPRDVSAEVLENVDPIFYGEVKQAAFKGLGLN